MNILKLEKRGMNFNKYDARTVGSDIGNYRVQTVDYDVHGKNGKDYFLEFTLGEKWQTRKLNKRNGEPLKHPVRELVASGVAFMETCYRADDGYYYRDRQLSRESYDKPRPYTERGILDLVNSFAAVPYDAIEYVS